MNGRRVIGGRVIGGRVIGSRASGVRAKRRLARSRRGIGGRVFGDDRGSAAAEFAVVVPAVVLVIALAAATLAGTSRQVRLEQAAAQGARLAARGEGDGRVRAAVAVLVSGARVAIGSDGDFDCVEVSGPSGVPLPLPALTASSCALSGGL